MSDEKASAGQVMPICPLCDSDQSESLGLVRLQNKHVVELRECLNCGEKYTTVQG